MKSGTLAIAMLLAAFAPLAAQEAAPSSTAEDIFNMEEEVTQAPQETEAGSPRDELLTSAAPSITGSFTGRVGFDWNWSDVWGSAFDPVNPTTYGLSQSSTGVRLGFVARPASDISVAGQLRASYPFTTQIEAVTSVAPVARTTTYSVRDFSVWSLYSKFNWKDMVFFTFGKQPIAWGTGYFFSPADDIFAQTEVDITDPRAEREGPLALKIQYPIPTTLHNLYLFAVLPRSSDPAALAGMKPEDIAVAGKAEVFFGNTELAVAGYYQRDQRPQAILMGTTGTGDFNFFAEGTAAFASPHTEAFIEEGATSWDMVFSSDYTVVDRSEEILFSGSAGMMYTNADWKFTGVGQYLYNGAGYSAISLGDILQAVMDRALSRPDGEPELSVATLAASLGGLGNIGQHYGVLSLGWTSLWDSDWDFSMLAIANLSDGSGYVRPTLSLSCLGHVTLSGSASLSWGDDGTEFADPAGLLAAFSEGNLGFVSKPTLSLALTASIGSTSF